MHRFVEDHAPTGWWASISDLYQKALDFEINGLASGRVRDRSPERRNRRFPSRFHDHHERWHAKRGTHKDSAEGGFSEEGSECGSDDERGSGVGSETESM